MEDVRRVGPPGQKSKCLPLILAAILTKIQFFQLAILIAVLPRLMFDRFSESEYSHVLSFEHVRDDIAELIVQACTKYKFDGIVLEVYFQLAGRVQDKHLLRLVEHLAKVLQMNRLDTVLVVPPLRNQVGLFAQQHFDVLYPLVTAFSLVTYDYSTIERPGANSPIQWVRETVEFICPESTPNSREKRQKILIGMNMYGMDYLVSGGGPIIGRQLIDLLKLYKGLLNHAEEHEENYFEFKWAEKLHSCSVLWSYV